MAGMRSLNLFPQDAWQSDVSPLKILITRATYPSQSEPNYALNLEVAEYINQKKANTPRDAAMMIAGLVNHRNPHVAMLALALLDTLVQSCGYPFHLQIATKEFLNELVRRFPERPPPFPGPVMSRILELIHGWKEGICQESRWKEDLGNIRDMHRLLTFKGYRFRDLPRQPQNLASASNLKTAEELENEDRVAQEAKLQELIRRGTPRDLAQAQELMKTLAGANPDAKPDYRTQALTELNKLESKVVLLNEMLDNVDVARGEKFVAGDVYDQVASILSSARPKIQGWISNAETDDPESLDTFLQINDQLNSVLNRYESFKKGDYVAASNPIPAELGGGAGSSGQGGLSLIDFDDSTPSGGTSTINELESLFGGGGTSTSSAPSNVIHPSFPNTAQQSTTIPPGMSFNPTFFTPNVGSNMGAMGMSTPPILNQTTHPGGVASPQPQQFVGSTSNALPMGSPAQPQYHGSIRLPGTPQVQAQSGARMSSPTPNYFGGPVTGGVHPAQAQGGMGMGTSMGSGMNGGSGMMMGGMSTLGGSSMTPQQAHPVQQPQQPQQQSQTSNQAKGKDPFADLVGLF